MEKWRNSMCISSIAKQYEPPMYARGGKIGWKAFKIKCMDKGDMPCDWNSSGRHYTWPLDKWNIAECQKDWVSAVSNTSEMVANIGFHSFKTKADCEAYVLDHAYLTNSRVYISGSSVICQVEIAGIKTLGNQTIYTGDTRDIPVYVSNRMRIKSADWSAALADYRKEQLYYV
jgi:hypothetical protein